MGIIAAWALTGALVVWIGAVQCCGRHTCRGAWLSPPRHKKVRASALDQTPGRPTQAAAGYPQGRRDAVITALFLDHGLRVGEVALLAVDGVDLARGTLTFHRPKVDKTQTHKLTADALRALVAYTFSGDAPPAGQLLRGSRKGDLLDAGMSARAITARIEVQGRTIGVMGLSAHDCRHYWASRAAEQGTDPFALQEAGGWSSLAMVRRYVKTAEIANARVKL